MNRRPICVFCGSTAQSRPHIRAQRSWEEEDDIVDDENVVDACDRCHTRLDEERAIALAPDMTKYITIADGTSTIVRRETEWQPTIATRFIAWRNNYSQFHDILKNLGWPPHV